MKIKTNSLAMLTWKSIMSIRAVSSKMKLQLFFWLEFSQVPAYHDLSYLSPLLSKWNNQASHVHKNIYNRVIWKSLPKLQFVYSKRKVSTKLFYAPKRGEKKFGPEYEATNEWPLHIRRI